MPIRITIGVKILTVALSLIVLMTVVALLTTRLARDVGMLLDYVIENYIPTYGAMARANIRSVEQALYLRRFIIRSLNTPDDRAATKREFEFFTRKGQETDAELAEARKRLAKQLQVGQHVRCVAVAISSSWSGERLADLLERVISVVGRPAAYLKDGGSELKKATDLLPERGLGSPVIDDISHAVANMLKRRYETHPQFSTFLSACGRVSGRLKHTVLACLTPPKVQTKSRFMNVHRSVRWADRVLGLLPAGRVKAGSVVAKLRTCLDELPACRTLIRQFRDDAVALLACQKVLKTRGLTHDTLRQCEPLLDTIASVRVRQEFVRSLQHQLETAKRLGLDEVGLPIRSDPIESLFGLSKQHGTGPLKDANRMALRMPALCGLPTDPTLTAASTFEPVSQDGPD
jgi:hypothetical protein